MHMRNEVIDGEAMTDTGRSEPGTNRLE